LLYESHQGLQKQYKVSCDELDFLVKKAKLSSDVLIARMMGGGFDGCTLNIVKTESLETFKKDIAKSYKEAFNNDCPIYNVNLSEGTRLITKNRND